MQIRFLLGPAGTGKTFRCLSEIRTALAAAPEGPPLVLLAPKQSTYELERQLLGDRSIPGYTRLNILSFERLAHFVFDRLGKPSPNLLDEEGRLMVLRGLLSKNRDSLQLFRASARLTGFAQQLSLALRELQKHQLTPDALFKLSEKVKHVEGLSLKLKDLGTLLRDYLAWLSDHNLHDSECLLSAATAVLNDSSTRNPAAVSSLDLEPITGQNLASKTRKTRGRIPLSNQSDASQLLFPLTLESAKSETSQSHFGIEQLWVDGFAEFAPQEIAFLAALAPQCSQVTLTFCLEGRPGKKYSWLSTWSIPQKCFEDCKTAFDDLPGAQASVEILERQPNLTRFAADAALQHLERCWSDPDPFKSFDGNDDPNPNDAVRIASCFNPEAEAVTAAREILQHIRAGGRYRDVAVLVRSLDRYHEVLSRIFSRYEIPFFLDRRESVAHHPLAELTRNAMRTIAFQWQPDDWFAALKSGLVPAKDEETDRLENEALSRGWKGTVWENPIVVKDQPILNSWMADLQPRLMPPFQKLSRTLGGMNGQTSGPQLAAALREFWADLKVEDQLESWAERELPASEFQSPGSLHATVWNQMNKWLGNLELAFPTESLRLREWLPIIEAGLSGLTVGIIPPALDQVLIGAIDRSRNPEIDFAILLGLNETVFPAAPQAGALLTEPDREELSRQNVTLSSGTRQQLGRERFFGYIGCTRARKRLLLTCALNDANGRALNPSPFISHIQRLFPSLEIEIPPPLPDWRESLHATELIAPILKTWGKNPTALTTSDLDHAASASSPLINTALQRGAGDTMELENCFTGLLPNSVPGISSTSPIANPLASFPALHRLIEDLSFVQAAPLIESLQPALAEKIYGPVLHTSVSRIEQFAACPFRFFVNSALRAEERKQYELDVREQGSFQHDVLAAFHQELRTQNKRWRDITPTEARERLERIGSTLLQSYKDGLLQATEESRFLGRVLIQALQDFVEVLVGWMQTQYLFDPVEVEFPFGKKGEPPAWEIELGNAHQLALEGRIDRIDFFKNPEKDEALAVVLDYKSSQKQLDPVFLDYGLQLQLLAYLNVLRRWPNPKEKFGVSRIIPAGVFYVNLRGRYDRELTRTEALRDLDVAKKQACGHTGRFDLNALPKLDSRPNAPKGDQFKYGRKASGDLRSNSREAMPTEEFEALLDSVEDHLRRMGREIFGGAAGISPFRKGSITACDHCQYQSICRIDPWTQPFRVLRKKEELS